VNIEFKSDNKKLLAHLKDLKEKVTPAAEAKALNSTANYIVRGAVKIAATKTGVQATLLRKRIAVPRGKKATARTLKTVVFGGLWVVPVVKINPKPRKLAGGRVKYKTVPGDAVRTDAFIAKTTKGTDRVFFRDRPSRKPRKPPNYPGLPIKNITADIGPHVRRAIEGYGGGQESQNYYKQRLFKEMDRAISGNLRRYGIRVR
jgi:hypothetical protein